MVIMDRIFSSIAYYLSIFTMKERGILLNTFFVPIEMIIQFCPSFCSCDRIERVT